ncbi:hypothetical protein [Streptomyces sp. KLOTTS4A1]|uniref:hypothetical protein n=1 Tax=Streptomyces sp. KLOTTS4A1 TaxID=3390996 RepID=UPI0039F4A940
MPTAIAVTAPDLILPPPDRHTPPAAVLQVPPDRGSRPLEASLADVHTLLEQHGYVIVLAPASRPHRAAHRLHAVRALLESDRIALLDVDLPPLGLAVLALQLRQLSLCDFSPGVLASAARLLSHYIYAGAVLGSVTKLDRVPVSLTQHAKSWVPGSQFAVLAGPKPQLIRLGGAGQGAGLEGPGFATRLHFAKGHLPTDWITDTLAPAWQVRSVAEAVLPAESARWWATGRLSEFAAAIPDISVLYQLVSSVRREDCHWCGLELIGDLCAFCSAPLLPYEDRARTAPPGQAALAPAHRHRAAAPALAPADPRGTGPADPRGTAPADLRAATPADPRGAALAPARHRKAIGGPVHHPDGTTR